MTGKYAASLLYVKAVFKMDVHFYTNSVASKNQL